MLGGEIVAAEEIVFEGAEAIVGSPEIEEGLLLWGVEALAGFGMGWRGGHGWDDICLNKGVQMEKVCGCLWVGRVLQSARKAAAICLAGAR